MPDLSGFPYAELQFTKEAEIFDSKEPAQLQDMLTKGAITDLLVMSHGWNNDMDEARALYQALTAKISSAVADQTEQKKFAVLGVLWPSKKFAEKELVAGGAASVGGNPASSELINQLEELHGFFDNEEADEILHAAIQVAGSIRNDKSSQDQFVQQMSKLFQKGVRSAGQQAKEDLINGFAGVNPGTLLVKLDDEGADADLPGPEDFQPGQMGSAASVGSVVSNVFRSAKNLLNFVTYYQMKERAGRVGLEGLHPVLRNLKAQFPDLRIHLIGHSFGGRLVTAATAGDKNSTFHVDSLILLQAAFSHYGFSEKYDGKKDGLFRSVVNDHKVNGVMLITYTHNDSAVGLAYAIASRIARQVAEGLGDADDRFGGLGGNGAQITPEANNNFRLAKQTAYNFQKGKLYNLNADAVITSHSDICKEEVARAIAVALKVASS